MTNTKYYISCTIFTYHLHTLSYLAHYSIVLSSLLPHHRIAAVSPRRLSPMIGCPGWAPPTRLRPSSVSLWWLAFTPYSNVAWCLSIRFRYAMRLIIEYTTPTFYRVRSVCSCSAAPQRQCVTVHRCFFQETSAIVLAMLRLKSNLPTKQNIF